MRLINIKAFLEREQLMRIEGEVDRRTKVLEFRDDETTEYAILSHRWIDPTEVDYEEMADLAKMDRKEQNEIRDRLGYKKIVDTCQQAKRDGYEWVWVDTSCIDKRSSAELSEAINSMYRWYRNARICYAYLHDVHGSSFPTKEDKEEYPKSKGWPEWFSRGWTLQEMIAPSDVQFFNKDWQPIGDKKTLAPTLTKITRVPGYILTGGLSSNRPCVARIMSWAANRMTTRIEDIAYSLMGLLDVNMPMLYGEGKKAFHRLQLEIIRTSNDQSIFAWSRYPGRPGSILADEPSFFNDCSEMVSLDYKEFTERLEASVRIRREQVPQLSFGVFPITNRGIQIWMLLRRHPDSDSIFEAVLPCRTWGPLVTIDLAVWNSNYYRYSPISGHRAEQPLEFRQVYLRYQDPCSELTFEIDDSAITENGFTCHDAYPSKLTGTTLTLTSTRPFCVKSYSKSQDNGLFAVSFGQYFGQDWVQIINDPPSEFGWSGEAGAELMLGGPGRAYSMADMPSQRDSRVWVYHICLPGSSSIVRISRVVWKKSRIGVRIEMFRDSGFHKGLNEWRALEVDVGRFSYCAYIITMTIYIYREPGKKARTYGVSCCAIGHINPRKT